MSEMIERVAVAINDRLRERGTMPIPFHAMRHAASAAIEALRKPTDAMIVAGDDRILAHLNSHEMMATIPTPSENCFTAMIDEALAIPQASRGPGA